MARIVAGVLLIVSACIYMGVSGFSEGESKKKISHNYLVMGIICLIAGIFFLHFGSFRSGMRSRLNEPVFSQEQLYGYKILNSKSWYDTSKGMQYRIDIKDIITPHKMILKNVEVLEKFYLKIGYSYLPNKPNAPPSN